MQDSSSQALNFFGITIYKYKWKRQEFPSIYSTITGFGSILVNSFYFKGLKEKEQDLLVSAQMC